MKRNIIIILTSLLLFGVSQDASAQKWLKTLGSIADAVLGDDNNSISSSSSSSSSSRSSSKKSKNKAKSASSASKHINVTLTEAVRYGQGCVRVGFVMENTSQENHQVIVKDTRITYGGNEYYPAAANIGQYGFEFLQSSFLDTPHLITYAFQRIPAGAKVKGYFYFTGVPDEITSFESLAFKAYFQSSTDGGYSFPIDNAVDATIETKMLPGMEISGYKTSDKENCVCTNPDIELSVKSLQRSGTTVTLTFTITNKSGKIQKYNFSEWSAYDENGTTYKTSGSPMRGLDMSMGNEKLWSSNIMKFVPDASATYKLNITDVPQSIKSFSLIRILFRTSDKTGTTDHFAKTSITIRNMDITAAPAAPAKKTTTTRTSSTYRKKTRR